jgi:hypothetical protein
MRYNMACNCGCGCDDTQKKAPANDPKKGTGSGGKKK